MENLIWAQWAKLQTSGRRRSFRHAQRNAHRAQQKRQERSQRHAKKTMKTQKKVEMCQMKRARWWKRSGGERRRVRCCTCSINLRVTSHHIASLRRTATKSALTQNIKLKMKRRYLTHFMPPSTLPIFAGLECFQSLSQQRLWRLYEIQTLRDNNGATLGHRGALSL